MAHDYTREKRHFSYRSTVIYHRNTQPELKLMGVIIIVSLICLALTVGGIWLVIYFPTKWLITEKYLKTIRLTTSIMLSVILLYYMIFTSPDYNHEYATINPNGNIYELTLTGERSHMSHDPISALSRKTFTDTFILNLPRNSGIIKANEIIKEGGYPLNGSIKIKDEKVIVNLYYDNYIDNIKDPLEYNGIYKLKNRDGI